jgi:Protein of unknown function (DUF2877)
MWPASRSRAALPARSGDAAFLRLLREEPFRGRVHSVFQRVVNLQRDDGELFTIACRDLDDAPNTLVVQAVGFARSGMAPGDAFETFDGHIGIGEWARIDLDDATGWDPLLPSYPQDDARLRANLTLARGQLARHRLGLAGHAAAAAASDLIARHARVLCLGLRGGDVEAACTAAKGLVGLGPGLTPSGDDFLVGFFAVLHLPGSPGEAFTSVCLAVLSDVERRTNAISAAALKAAAHGRVRASLHALIGELVAGEGVRVEAAMARVLAIGSSSGADIAGGLLAGFRCQLEARGAAACH